MVVVNNKKKIEENIIFTLKEPVKTFAISYGDADWLTADDNFVMSTIEDAELVIFPGGSDINPALYNEQIGSFTHFYREADERQLKYFKPYIGKKKFFGICRGLQLLTAMAGGKLVQHSSHPYFHRITTYDGKILGTNSLHHQQAYLLDMPKEDYQLLAWAENLSPMHLDGTDSEYPTGDSYKEPEVVHYPNIGAMGIQGHPEMGGMPQETRNWLIEQIKSHLFYEKIIV